MDEKKHLAVVNNAVNQQIKAMIQWQSTLNDSINLAIGEILQCRGHVVVAGVGKSGLIGKKIVATFASTGTPSFFIHPTEAFHGDLGMIMPSDVMILISYSGETDEVNKLIPSLKGFGNLIIAMTGNLNSTLAKFADITLNIGIEQEICPNNLAPTSSTLVTLALGDALAVGLMKARDFKPEDFAKFHPGGSLGRKLLCKVSDVMKVDNLPFIVSDASLSQCLLAMTASKTGVALVGNKDNLQGIITDGDIRRALLSHDMDIAIQASDVMTTTPHIVLEDEYVIAAEKYLQKHKINTLIVENKKHQVIGLFEMVV